MCLFNAFLICKFIFFRLCDQTFKLIFPPRNKWLETIDRVLKYAEAQYPSPRYNQLHRRFRKNERMILSALTVRKTWSLVLKSKFLGLCNNWFIIQLLFLLNMINLFFRNISLVFHAGSAAALIERLLERVRQIFLHGR